MPLFGRSGRRRSATTIFYATDVHGSERTWRKFLNAATFYDADVLVMGGDVMGKLTIPIIRESRRDRYRATIHGRVERLETQADVDGREERIGFLGFYDTVMDEDEYAAIRGRPRRGRSPVHRARGRAPGPLDRPGRGRLGPGIRCYATGGNDDVTEVMARHGPHRARAQFVGCEGRAVQLDDRHIMVSMPYVNPTPWHTPREAPEPELAERIERVAGDLPDYAHAIFNFHAPPIDSTLDTCPQLDWTTDPPSQIVRGGQPVLYGAGSRPSATPSSATSRCSACTATSTSRRRRRRSGRTLCVNPGSEYGEGVLRGCLITIADGQVKGYQMTAG